MTLNKIGGRSLLQRPYQLLVETVFRVEIQAAPSTDTTKSYPVLRTPVCHLTGWICMGNFPKGAVRTPPIYAVNAFSPPPLKPVD